MKICDIPAEKWSKSVVTCVYLILCIVRWNAHYFVLLGLCLYTIATAKFYQKYIIEISYFEIVVVFLCVFFSFAVLFFVINFFLLYFCDYVFCFVFNHFACICVFQYWFLVLNHVRSNCFRYCYSHVKTYR